MPSADIDVGSQQISCGEKLNGIPKFNNIEDHRQWIKEHMAACFRVMARQGFTEGLAGHISVRDPAEPHHFWMNPLGKHFAMMTASDMTMVDYDGNVLQGGSKTVNAAGFQIHSAIHKAHPHIHAACHAHGVNGRAWSVFGRPLDIMTQDHCIFYQAHSVYHNFGGVVFDKAEAERLAAALGPEGKGLILQNHGLLTVGHTADEATYLFTLMERLCEVQLKVDAVQGLKKVLVKDEVAEYTKSTASSADDGYIEFQPEFEYELKLSKGELRE